MSKLDHYSIPWDIMQMAQFNEQAIILSYQEWIEVPAQNTEQYVQKFKHLVYMEEAANLIKLKEYDLENVPIQPDYEHQTITVVILILVFIPILVPIAIF